jgi:hypothetical protein
LFRASYFSSKDAHEPFRASQNAREDALAASEDALTATRDARKSNKDNKIFPKEQEKRPYDPFLPQCLKKRRQ